MFVDEIIIPIRGVVVNSLLKLMNIPLMNIRNDNDNFIQIELVTCKRNIRMIKDYHSPFAGIPVFHGFRAFRA